MPTYGFSGEKPDTKFLILYIMKSIGRPADFQTLTEMARVEDNLDYFVFADAFAELVDSEHILKVEENLFYISAKGLEISEVVERELAASLRKAAREAVRQVRDRQRRDEGIKTETETVNGELYLTCSLSDGNAKMMELSLFVATPEQARVLAGNFRANAEDIYSRLLESLIHPKEKKE